MADKDFTKRLQSVEERLEKIIKEKNQFYSEVSALVMEVARKQNALVDRLELEGVFGEKRKIVTIN